MKPLGHAAHLDMLVAALPADVDELLLLDGGRCNQPPAIPLPRLQIPPTAVPSPSWRPQGGRRGERCERRRSRERCERRPGVCVRRGMDPESPSSQHLSIYGVYEGPEMVRGAAKSVMQIRAQRGCRYGPETCVNFAEPLYVIRVRGSPDTCLEFVCSCRTAECLLV